MTIKRTIIFATLVTLIGWLLRTYTSQHHVIEVDGPPGIRFSGYYVSVDGSGHSNMQNVVGTTPMSFDVVGGMVSCNFQKSGAEGTLTVSIVTSGITQCHSENSAPFGIVYCR